ncbi:MAG: IniB N-terminal domain-containing protein [Microbacterium sp.]|uniref:IniB N-terminal domain-containing protein n=1 Tax=Microbacterium sp. TaxID=51671 RepID=UPI00261AFB70|nr:IniB N-terminal domain-containing protein [Microbacterium sp.]MCX6501793.1 IniB N-terminal domain-containing protein [Microbacterium sp.]
MSVTLVTVADALIEFILSLLRDPDAAAKFDEDPNGTLAGRGLNTVTHAEVCAVAPIVIDRPAIVPAVQAVSPPPARPANEDPVINEIRSIINNFAYVDDRDTVVDQSVNQNIWADGDVNQVFDQGTVVASGDNAVAAGDDVDIDQTLDESSHIDAGGDVNMGNDTTTSVVADSNNTATDTTTTTDASSVIAVTDSANDSSTTQSAAESYNETATTTTDSTTGVDADVVYGSDGSSVVDSPVDDQF